VPLHFEGEKMVMVQASFFNSPADAVLNGPSGPVPPFGQPGYAPYWLLDDPSAGEYSLSLRGMGVNGRATTALIAYASATATGFTGQVSPPLVAARPVTLRAALDPGSYQTAATAVTAKVSLAGGTPAPAPVELRDDGAAPDATAGDGTFTAVYQPAGVGRYAVEFNAAGKYADGRDLNRATASYFEDRWLPGDINGDLEIDVQDAVLSLQMIVGVLEPNDLQRGVADVNRDTQVTVEDTILILQHIVFGTPLEA
jgi:hypothetical protein